MSRTFYIAVGGLLVILGALLGLTLALTLMASIRYPLR